MKNSERSAGNSAQVLLGIVLIGFFAWLMEGLVFRRIERRHEGWRGQQVTSHGQLDETRARHPALARAAG